MSRAFYCILWAFVLLEALEVARGHPEYRALIPNGNAVTWHGASWVGVGHFASAGGGPRNPFGQHFAAAGYNWTRSLCLMDSDGDGWSNGLELGDPDCLWKAGSGLPPSRTSCITHPGLADDRPTPECTAMLTAAAGGPAMNTIPSSPSMVVPASTGKPENWCGERRAAGQLPTVWHTLPLPTTSLIAQSDIYTCYKFELPAEEDIPDDMDLVAVQIAHDSGLHLHHIFVMHCDPDMHWIEDAVDEPYMCKIHSGSLLASCHALWTAPRISADMDCAKPGHILANAGDLRRRGKGIVAQAHWSFGGRTLGQPIIITNSSVGLGFVQRSMQIPEPEQVGHYYFSAILGPNPQTGNYQPLAIPPQQQAYEVDYECGRRCSLVPLRGNPAKPQKYVTILGYRFHMHYHGVNMSIRIKRCPNNYNGESDVEWRVDGFNVAFQPIYEVTNGVKLYAGDTVEWSCTYNTMSVNTTVYGGYGFSVDEMCQGSLVYYPAVDSFTGCYADQYDNNVCSYEVTAMIKEHDKYDEDFPMRRFLDPWSAGPFSWSVGWKATWLAVMVLGTTALLWGMHFLMLWFSRFKTSSGHTFVGPITHTPPLRAACPKRGCVSFRALASRLKSGLAFIGQRYTACSTKHRRNVCMYITRLVLTTPGFFIMAWLMLLQWCLCGDLAMQLRSVQLMVSLLVAMYLCEILWKTGLDPLILAHHMTTVAIIIVIGMELIWRTSKSCDVLLVMALFAYLEQPFMLSLVFYRLAPEWRGLATMWTFSTWFFTLSKLLSVGVGVWLMWLRWDVMPTWTRVVYPLCWVAMSVLQGINARIQFAITRKIRNRLQETSSKRGSCRDGDSVGLPDKDSSEQGKERCPSLDTVCYVPSSATEALEGTVCDAVAGRGPHGEKGGGSVTPGSTTTISSLEGVIDVPIHNESNNVSVV